MKEKIERLPRYTMFLGVIILLLLFYGIGMTGAFFLSYQNDSQKEVTGQEALAREKEEKKKLEEENASLKKALQEGTPAVSGTCDFTKTLKIVGFLTNYTTATEDDVIVIVDRYQSFAPFIIHLTEEQAKNLEIGKYYEFSYSGQKSLATNNPTLDGFQILKIVKTDRTGLDQIQEGCK